MTQATPTIIRHRRFSKGDGIVYADLVLTVLTDRMDTRRHIYRLHGNGKTSLVHDRSYADEKLGIANWDNVPTASYIT